jgi:hypothetical protein
LLDAAASAGDGHLFFGQNHMIYDIIFYTNEVPQSSYASNEFYIDEFALSSTPRTVIRTQFPKVTLSLS